MNTYLHGCIDDYDSSWFIILLNQYSVFTDLKLMI